MADEASVGPVDAFTAERSRLYEDINEVRSRCNDHRAAFSLSFHFLVLFHSLVVHLHSSLSVCLSFCFDILRSPRLPRLYLYAFCCKAGAYLFPVLVAGRENVLTM